MVANAEKTSFDLLGKRWSALIVRDLINGPRRFREILHDVGRINDKVLSQRLKELEELGILQRRVFAEVPVRVEYTLTAKGQSLARVIGEMEHWDAKWIQGEMEEEEAPQPEPVMIVPAAPPPAHPEPLTSAPLAVAAELLAPTLITATAPAPIVAAALSGPVALAPIHEVHTTTVRLSDSSQSSKASFWRRLRL